MARAQAKARGASASANRSKAPRRAKSGAAGLRANARAKSPAQAPLDPLVDSTTTRDIAGVALAVLGTVSLISVFSKTTAPVPAAVSGFFHLGFGLGGYVLPLFTLLLAACLFRRGGFPLNARAFAGGALIFVAVLSILSLSCPGTEADPGLLFDEAVLTSRGGYLGSAVASGFQGLFGKVISMVILVGIALAGAIVIGFSVTGAVDALRERLSALAARRRVEVNESPWGDGGQLDAPAEGGPASRRRAPAPGQAALFDGDGTQETTFLGSRETTVLADGPDEDEDPFVDVSDQVEAERAKTAPLGRGANAHAAAGGLETPPFKASEPGPASKPEAAFEAKPTAPSPATQATAAQPPAAAPAAPEPPQAPAQPIPDFLKRRAPRPEEPGAEKAPERIDGTGTAEPEQGKVVRARGIEGAETPAGGESGRVLPPASMLRHNPHSASAASSQKELEQTASALQATLGEFKLHSQVVGWISGPTVTTFKVQPGEGERVSRISNLEDDIALSLAAQSVRIFAPIPGTSLVGIEIPNAKRQNVNLGDVLPYVHGGPLELAIGRDAEGAPIVADLAKMPHLLIAGTTGSGKSVMINSIVMSLLMRTFPEDVRLIMVDPKRVELSGYNGLPHLYVPVVTEPKQAASALQWAVSEMERRLKVFERIGVRKISTFNEKQAAGEFEKYDNPPAKMPYLVIIIDELSDLMMVAGKDVEASIVRIAQLGRAAGIHLIVATQRPSSNVVTGLIKANITNRIAFNVATGIDSRVIIDQMGAEKLTGYGDMLFSKVDWGKPKRIQGCFVSDDEINSVIDFVREQGGAEYHEEILSAVAPASMSGGVAAGGSGGPSDTSEDDPLLWEAAQIVVESQLGSTSGLQRRLKVGYARAGRIMDMLEEKGVVGPPDGSKPREVLLDEEGLEALRQVEDQMAGEDRLGVL